MNRPTAQLRLDEFNSSSTGLTCLKSSRLEKLNVCFNSTINHFSCLFYTVKLFCLLFFMPKNVMVRMVIFRHVIIVIIMT